MAETGASAPTAAGSTPSPVGDSPSQGQVNPSGPTKHSAKSEVDIATEGDQTDKTTSEADDEEYDIDGEKIRKSVLFDRFKRQKEFERASHKRMQEAAEERKRIAAEHAEYERAFQTVEQDPYAIQRARGMTDEQIDAIAEKRLVDRMKRAQMTPEQIEAETTKQRLQAAEAELSERKQTEAKTKHEAAKQQAKTYWDTQIAQAMEAGNLARTASTGAKVASVMAEYMRAGEKIEPVLAAQIVRDNHQTEIRHEFTELREQAKAGRITQDKFIGYVSDLIGADTVKAIQQSAIKQAQNFEPQKPRTPAAPPALPKKGFDSFDEAKKWIDERIK